MVESAPAGTLVGITAFASDADATNNTVTYSLTDDAAARSRSTPTPAWSRFSTAR